VSIPVAVGTIGDVVFFVAIFAGHNEHKGTQRTQNNCSNRYWKNIGHWETNQTSIKDLCELRDSLCSLCPFFRVTKSTSLPAGRQGKHKEHKITAPNVTGKTSTTRLETTQTFAFISDPMTKINLF
jgi:hypothetical protein